ncbi:hypothetical protein ACFORO_09750 [Amycolatopsis halotolerans]|uniref:Uncharacterized protein n=1 Tax=Amycolatopsis halotolerans TaxID=330083 RepID=A0ABV7QBE4_9PSEU
MADDEVFEMREIDFYEYDEGARRLLSQGASREELIAGLRGMGCPKIGCIDVVSRIAEISVNEAKLLVHNSAAWADTRRSDERFQRRVEKAARKFGTQD